MSVVIDDISLQIEYNTNNASDGIDKLADSLKKLKSQLSVKGLEKLSNGLMSVNASVLQLNEGAIGNVERLASALRDLSSIQGLGRTLRNINAIPTPNANTNANNTNVDTPDASQNINNVDIEASNTTRTLENLEEQTNRVTEATRRATPQLDRVRESLRRVSKTTTQANGVFSKLIKSLGRILFYRIIRGIIKSVTEAFKEGIQNIARYSSALNEMDAWKVNENMSKLATSILYLKNALGTLVAPIIQLVTPAIVGLVNGIVACINAVNQLIASLNGLSKFTKAKVVTKDYAKELDKASGSAKKLKDNLQGFDELNVIRSQDSSGATDYSSMFEEADVNPNGALSKIMDLLNRAKDQFMKGWNEVWDKLDIANRIEKLKGYLENIKKVLGEIFSDPAVQQAMMNFFDSFFYNLGRISASLFSIGLSMAEFLFGGISKFLSEKKDDIKAYLIEAFNIGAEVMNLLGDLAVGIATIFTAFGSDSGIRFSSAFITSLWEIYSNATLLCEKLIRDILTLVVLPISENADGLKQILEDVLNQCAIVLEGFSKLFDDVGNTIQTTYDEHIKPFIDDVAQGVSDLVGDLVDTWNSDLKPMFDDLAEDINNLLVNYITPAMQSTIEALQPVIDIIKILWHTIIQPLFSWLITEVYPILVAKAQFLLTVVISVIKVMCLHIENLMNTIKIILQFFVDVFTVGWTEAFNNLKDNWVKNDEEMVNKWSQAWEDITGALKRAFDNITQTISNMWSSIGGLFDNIKSKFQEIKSDFSNGISLNINQGSSKITQHANGGMPNTGQMFIARESGAELVGAIGTQTTVANNEQIVAGIQGGVESAINNMLAPYLSALVSSNNEIASKEFGITDSALANSVRNSAKSYYVRNGSNMFNFS